MRSRNAELTKQTLARMAKASRVIARALRVLLALAFVVLIPFIGLVLFSILAGNAGAFALEATASLASLVLAAVIIPLILVIAIRIFDDIAAGSSPFTEKQAKRIRLVGILLAAGFLSDTLASLVDPIIMNVDGLRVGIGAMESNAVTLPLTTVNIGILAASIVAFCLSYAFKYGALLQQLSDDTV